MFKGYFIIISLCLIVSYTEIDDLNGKTDKRIQHFSKVLTNRRKVWKKYLLCLIFAADDETVTNTHSL
jgi:hypothetical protein